ncbi:MAG: hypothetical protein LBL65_05695 [Campylobacteraceae bacterium]|jgi:hypothetical protein|nr:hypothetical protein [Campylobacteraceae bacterium]
MKILNLTQHLATKEQKEQRVIDLPDDMRKELCALLTFDTLEEALNAEKRAKDIMWFVSEHYDLSNIFAVMIGGAPFLIKYLEAELALYDLQPLHAFTQRIVLERQNDEGTITKQSMFKHIGFVPEPAWV